MEGADTRQVEAALAKCGYKHLFPDHPPYVFPPIFWARGL